MVNSAAPNQGLWPVLENMGWVIIRIIWPETIETYHAIEYGVLTLFFLGIVLSAVLFYRTSQRGIRTAFTNPSLFQSLHGPWWGPLTMASFTLASVFALPFYRPGAGKFVPQTWLPAAWITPSTHFVERVVAMAVLLAFVAILILLRRLFRETIHNSACGDAGWASRSEIVIQPSWTLSIPVVVSWRGTRKFWGWPKFHKEAWKRVIARFIPSILQAEFTVVAPSLTTLWEHCLLLGQTGSGKGMGIFGAIIASAKIKFGYQDVKAECPGHDKLWKMTGLEPIRFGRAAIGGWPSMRWNPLREALDDPETEDAVGALASMLIPTSRGGSGNDFVKAAARPLLTHCLLSRRFEALADLRAAIRDKGLTTVLTDLQTPPGYMAALQGKNMTEYVTDAFLVALTPYSVGWGRRVSSAHDFTLSDFFDRGGFVLSAETDPSLNLPIRVFWRFLFRRMLASNRRIEMLLLMDEALAAGPLEDADNALVTLRSKAVSIWYGVQNLSGLRDVYGGGDKGQRVIDSFNNSITLLHALNDADRNRLVETLDKCTVMERRSGQMEKIPVSAPLISSSEIQRRGRAEDEYWAVFRFTGVTRSANPVVGRLVPTTGQLVRTPTTREREEALHRYGQAEDPGHLSPDEAMELQAAKATAARLESVESTPAVSLEPVAAVSKGPNEADADMAFWS